jgi:DNA-directed RNA polymerase specialized sigma24 family protein
MRHYLGLTERETAHELRMAIGTVKSSNARALDKLRRDPTLSKEDEHDGITR